MKSLPFLVVAVAIHGSCLISNLRAQDPEPEFRAVLTASIDSEQAPPIDCYFVPAGDGYDGKWVIGTPGYNEWEWETTGGESGQGGSVELEGMLDPDPSITFALGVIDFGAPSNFSFSFVLPLSPQVSNPSRVKDSLDGSVTNSSGSVDGGVTVTALPPPIIPLIPQDGDLLIPELQVFTLSDDGGLTWKNVGLDQGPTTFVPLAPNTSGNYGTFNEGFIPTIAGGAWTHMRVDLNFRLSGGGDAFSFSGAKILVPEPGSLMLVILAATGAAGFYRRRR